MLFKVQKKYKEYRCKNDKNCAVCGSKKLRFMKEQEAKGLLSNLGIKTPLSKLPLLNVVLINLHIKRIK